MNGAGSHPERIIPDETESGVVELHAVRYRFALEWCEGLDVLDAACGAGYGASILSTVARRVLGVDVSADAVAYARSHYGSEALSFEVMDVTALELPDASVDVVCSFETLEHVENPVMAVSEAARVLRRRGVLIASTPHVQVTDTSPANPFHRVEFSPRDFEALLRSRFRRVELFGQHRHQTARHRIARRLDVLGLRRRLKVARAISKRVLGTMPTGEVRSSDLSIVRGRLAGATEIVAVCTMPLES